MPPSEKLTDKQCFTNTTPKNTHKQILILFILMPITRTCMVFSHQQEQSIQYILLVLNRLLNGLCLLSQTVYELLSFSE